MYPRQPTQLPVTMKNNSDRELILKFNLRADLDCINLLAPVVQTMDSAVHRINHYPGNNSIGFASVYPLDSDLSGGQRYPSFEQLGPVC